MRAYENIPLKQIAINGYDLEANGHQAGRLRADQRSRQHSRNQSKTQREMNIKPIEVMDGNNTPEGIHGSFRQYKESSVPNSNRQPSPREITSTPEQVNHIPDKHFDEM